LADRQSLKQVAEMSLLFCELGNHVGLRGLLGGAEGNRTDGHRGLAASNRGILLLTFKGAYGGTQTLSICRYLPISLRFHSLSCRARAMVVPCSRALTRLRLTADRLIVEFFGPSGWFPVRASRW
jgi:hypothetical protein